MTIKHTPTGIGKMIRDARIKQGLTVAQLADRIGVDRAVVNKYELGINGVPLSRIPILAKELDLTVSDLVHAA